MYIGDSTILVFKASFILTLSFLHILLLQQCELLDVKDVCLVDMMH